MLAPITTLERLNDPAWRNRVPDRLMYDGGSLQLLPIREPVPLIIDHDKSRSIGRVESLWRLEMPEGPWTCASVTVTDPPAWLKRGTPASFEITAPKRCSFGNPILRHGYVTEVSVLSPGLTPAEPGARVVVYKPVEPKAPAAREDLVVREVARRHVGRDLVIDMSDGTQEIYCGGGQRLVRTYETTITVR